MPKWWNSMPLYWTRPSEPVCGNVKKCDKCPASTSPQAVWTKNTYRPGVQYLPAQECRVCLLHSQGDVVVAHCHQDRHGPSWTLSILRISAAPVFFRLQYVRDNLALPNPRETRLSVQTVQSSLSFGLCQKESHPHFVHFINNPSCETWKRWKGPW